MIVCETTHLDLWPSSWLKRTIFNLKKLFSWWSVKNMSLKVWNELVDIFLASESWQNPKCDRANYWTVTMLYGPFLAFMLVGNFPEVCTFLWKLSNSYIPVIISVILLLLVLVAVFIVVYKVVLMFEVVDKLLLIIQYIFYKTFQAELFFSLQEQQLISCGAPKIMSVSLITKVPCLKWQHSRIH